MRYDWPDFVHRLRIALKMGYTHPSHNSGPGKHMDSRHTSLLIDIAIWQTALVLGTFFIELKSIRARRDLNPRPPG
jgi:hypothetical protein